MGGARIRQLAVDTNFVFKVVLASGECFALRVQRPGIHEPAHTELELWWLEALVRDGLPVAAPVRTLDGRLMVDVPSTAEVPEPHRCVLFTWLPGSEPDEASMAYWETAGELAARLHRQSAGLEPPAHIPLRRWDRVFAYEEPVLLRREHREVITDDRRAILQHGIDRLDEVLGGIYAGRAGEQLLHGDLHEGNLRMLRGRLSVFDFEDLIVGWPLHDLAILLYGPYYNSGDWDSIEAATRRGYERAAPWPINDPGELRALFAARALGLVNLCLVMGPEHHAHIERLTARVEAYLT